MREMRFTDGSLEHEVVVEPWADGRPGERLLAPSRTGHPPRMCPDGTREDFQVVLDERASVLAAVCLRRIEPDEHVEESGWTALKRMLDFGFDGTFELDRTTIAGEEAYGYTVLMPRSTLTDWKLAHAGWLYVVGTVSVADPAVHAEALRRARESLATWTWIDPA